MNISPPIKKCILVVDEEVTNQLLVVGLLCGHYQMRMARSRGHAFALAHHDLPDLILLGVMMPGIDSYARCSMLKANPVTRAIPVIFLTSQTDAHGEEHVPSLEAADYIMRPVRPGILFSPVRVSNQDLSKEFLSVALRYADSEDEVAEKAGFACSAVGPVGA